MNVLSTLHLASQAPKIFCKGVYARHGPVSLGVTNWPHQSSISSQLTTWIDPSDLELPGALLSPTKFELIPHLD